MELPVLLPKLWLLAGAAVVGAVVLIVILVVLIQFFRKAPQETKEKRKTLFDFAAAPPVPPDTSQPHAQVYGTPVRVLMVVLAPVGRTSQLPIDGHGQLLSAIDPQLPLVVARDNARIELWPAQLSAAGFCQSFFNQTAMPGNGKGTPWCAVAGKADNLGSPILVGLICVAAAPNASGEILVEHEGNWRDILRVGNN